MRHEPGKALQSGLVTNVSPTVEAEWRYDSHEATSAIGRLSALFSTQDVSIPESLVNTKIRWVVHESVSAFLKPQRRNTAINCSSVKSDIYP
jgi:hypothetical protein